MRRLALLLMGGAIWLFLAAIPVLADGGPHVSSINSGASSLTADSCAGCHRAHTGQGEYLLTQSEGTLCLSCHGGAGTGATTDVENGVQYEPNVNGSRSAVTLGALRDGGFLNARIGASNPSRQSYQRGWEDGPYNTVPAISQRPKVPVGTAEAITSAHIDLTETAGNGIADIGLMWGKGAINSGQGTAQVTLACVECHNPHGNDAYRILKPVPGSASDPLGGQLPITVKATYANADRIVTSTQHGLVGNDKVTLTGVGGLTGTYYVSRIVNGFTFEISAAKGDQANPVALANGSGGTVVRADGVPVMDSPVDPDGNSANGIQNPTKNYTILQVKGQQGSNGTFLLYAQDVINARSGAGVVPAQPAVSLSASVAVTVGTTAYWYQTSGAHGLALGDRVTLTGTTLNGGTSGSTCTVRGVRSSGSVYDQVRLTGTGCSPTTAAAAVGTLQRNALPAAGQDFSANGGDYFRRTVPWNPALVNAQCSNSTFSTANTQQCATMNDAPNGVPNTIVTSVDGGVPSTLVGQMAFLDQTSTWCASCHTRYYSNTNENLPPPNTLEVISTLDDIPVGATDGSDRIFPGLYSGEQFGSPSYGDQVTLTGVGTVANGTYYVIETGSVPRTNVSPSPNNPNEGNYFKVATSMGGAAQATGSGGGGTFTKVYQSSSSSWGYPRNENGTMDAIFKYQHSTSSNRACTVCHVAHGSNAAMPGAGGTTFSANAPYPGMGPVGVTSISAAGLVTTASAHNFAVGVPVTISGATNGNGKYTVLTVPASNTFTVAYAGAAGTGGTVTSTSGSSRLLKVDNRGTCQMCHDPTGTIPAGIGLPNSASPPTSGGYTGNTSYP